MPEDITPPKPEGFPDAASHNAEIAQKLAAQDVLGQSTAPVDDGFAGDALDALAKSAEESKKAAEAVPEAPVAPPAKSEEDLAKEKEAAEQAERTRKRADELFKDSPSLPPGASHKSSESFSAIKVRAAQEIAKAEAELEKLRKENADFQEKLKNTAPPETLKELEDHRAWRAKLDVEADPKWKQFDKEVSATREFIYSQLSRSPAITPEVIAEIKKHGGPENVQMDKIFAAIADPALQRTVESKLADIEQRKFEKGKAIEAAKTNISEYVSGREKEAVAALTQHNAATEKHLSEITQKLDWFTEKPIDPKATDEVRKEAEAANAFVKQTKDQLKIALTDDSPEMRAIMIAGMAQLFRLQAVHKSVADKLAAAEKALTDVTGKYDKLRSGSVTRLRESNASPNASPLASKGPDYSQSSGDALDSLRKAVTEERARAAAQ